MQFAIFPSIFLLVFTSVVLIFISRYDNKTMLINPLMILLIAIYGIIFFAINTADLLLLITNIFIMCFIFVIPLFFGLGLGDFLLVISMCLFFTEEIFIKVYLACFIISAFIWTIYQIDKYNLWHNKKEMLKMKFPFAPPISIGFICFVVYYILINLL